jgi:Cu2+-containing amine oxidase
MAAGPYRFQGKGLSIAQPKASAIAFAGKDIENRSWCQRAGKNSRRGRNEKQPF